jgi:hypothetical protein
MITANVGRSSAKGYANPFMGKQAPDHLTLGHAVQLDLPGETKAFPFLKPFPKKRMIPGVPMLPQFEFGVIPTFNRQQGSEASLRGKDMPSIRVDSRMISADLVETYAKIENSQKCMPTPLSENYEGSQWNYGPREGLPLRNVTNASNFVKAYGENVSQERYNKLTQGLVAQGYEPERIHRVLEQHLDNALLKKISAR